MVGLPDGHPLNNLAGIPLPPEILKQFTQLIEVLQKVHPRWEAATAAKKASLAAWMGATLAGSKEIQEADAELLFGMFELAEITLNLANNGASLGISYMGGT